jgi:thiol-disulfide isomerase/thioredoxin
VIRTTTGRLLLLALLSTPACAAEGEALPGPALEEATAADVLSAVRAAEAKAVLVNIWATWCQPCREEMPDLLALEREYGERGFELVLVSGDFDDARPAAREFLASQGVDFPSFIKNESDQAFIDALSPEWNGGLPASFLYDARGDLVSFWEGKVSREELEPRIVEMLDDAVTETAGRP